MHIADRKINEEWGITWPTWINPYSDLEERIRKIVESQFVGSITEEQKTDLQQCVKLAHSWVGPAGRMKKLFNELPEPIIKEFMLQQMEGDGEKKCDYNLQRILSLLNKQLLLQLSEFKTHESAANFFKGRGVIKSDVLRSSLEKEGRAIYKEFFVDAKSFAHQFVQTLIGLTGLNALKIRDDDLGFYEARSMLKTYWQLIISPITIFGLIKPYVKLKAPAAILTSVTIVATLTALVAYNRYWKPCPIECYSLKNLSTAVLGKSSSLYPRTDILHQIEMAFQANKAVLLVGSPGSGKSSIGRFFAEQAVAGEICRFIKDPQIFECNASTFVDQMSLSRLQEYFKGYEKQVVFFFDEFHSLFIKDRENFQKRSASQEIKTFFDDYKQIIGATTTVEYEKYIKKEETIEGRRFEVIVVNPMTDEEMQIALSQQLEDTNSNIPSAPSVIEYIIQKAEEFNRKTSKIDAAQSLLNLAIQQMSSTVHTESEHAIAKLQQETGVLKQRIRCNKPGEDSLALLIEFEEKQKLLRKKQADLEQKRHRAERMRKMEANLLKLKRQSYHLANPDVDLSEGTELARKWVELHARIAVVTAFIAKERKELGFPECLNEELIDKILSKRKDKDTQDLM